MRKTGENIFTSLLGLLHVKHTKAFSDKYFNEHPHKYNLFGISKMLSDYGIENAGTKIADKEADIFDIELPFVAHFGNEFVIVYQVNREEVRFLWKHKKMAVPVAEFLSAWDGIILLAEPGAASGEPGYKKNRQKERLDYAQKSILTLAVCILLGVAYITWSLYTRLGVSLLLTINFIGICIGYLLVLKQMHIHSEYADKICSLFRQSDCNNVLESKAAKLWGVFGWSEIGLGYFAANVSVLIFRPHWVSYLAVINLLALPYSFWSVWYQKVKAKQWCVLCLIVQVLFWLAFVVNLLFGYLRIPDFNLAAGLSVGCVFVSVILVINLLIPKLSEGRKVQQLNQEINSIKVNEAVFKALLKEQPYYEVNKSDSQLLLGNPDAGLRVTVFSNPYCNPCAQLHKRIDKLLKDAGEEICVQYILCSFGADLDFANKYLIAACLEKDQNTVRDIFNAWFEGGKYLKETFFKDMCLNMEDAKVEREFQQHALWKEKTQIRYTPVVLINGCQLPNNYKIEDLRYFTEFNVDVK